MPKVVSARRPQHKPKLGQHFLSSDSFAMQIVDALGDVSQHTVLEIGPGRGVLTSLLAKRAQRLIAVELDRVLAAQLRLRFGMFPNVEVIEADILSIDFDSLFGPKPGLRRPGIEFKPTPAKVIGNLPYYITSDILLRLFEYAKYFELNRGNKLPEATLYSWDNATGDPEMFTGYLLNPNLPFSAWKEKEIGEEVAALFAIADYDKRIAAYKEINKKAVEYGAIMPLLQSVITIVSRKDVTFEHYHNGWILADTITRT